MNTIFRIIKSLGLGIGLYGFLSGALGPGLFSAIAAPVHYGASTVGQSDRGGGDDPNVQHYGASVTAQPAKANQPTPSRAERFGSSTVTLRQSDCRLLERHVPAADVAYRPGVTKGDGKVAAADLSPPSEIGKTSDLAFTFTVRLDRPLPTGNNNNGNNNGANFAGDVLGEAPIGRVEFQNGVVSFNGVPISDDQARGLSAGCREMLKKSPRQRDGKFAPEQERLSNKKEK